MIEPSSTVEPTFAARAVALTVVLLDVLYPLYHGPSLQVDESLLALLGVVAVLCLANGAEPLLGLRRAPLQGWLYWCRLTVIFGLVVGAICAAVLGVMLLAGFSPPIYKIPPHSFLPSLIFMCVSAPLWEELVYRSLLAVAVYPTCGRWGTIVLSGLIFGLVHVLRGIPSPENQVAGFLLAWAFLKSGTVLVPIALHSAGNFVALCGQIVTWTWVTPTA